MLTGVRRIPIRYEPGTILDSSEKLRIFPMLTQDYEYVEDYAYLGTPLKIAEDMHKVLAYEQYHDFLLERGFIQFKNEEVIPIYLKIYDHDKAYVLYYRVGIHEVVSQCNHDDIPNQFTKYYTANKYFDYLREYNWIDDVPSYDDVFNAEQLIIRHGTNKYQKFRVGWSSEDVEWRADTLGPDGIRNIVFRYTTAMEDESSMRYVPTHGVLSPDLGRYLNVAYDPFTVYAIHEIAVEPRDMIRWSANSNICGNRANVELAPFKFEKPVTQVENYTDDWLELCHLLQLVALPEFKIVVELYPNYSSTMELIQDSRKLIKGLRLDFLKYDLVSILKSFGIGKYIIYKNAYDEVFIDATLTHPIKTRVMFYVDLTLAVILTKNIIHHARDDKFVELDI